MILDENKLETDDLTQVSGGIITKPIEEDGRKVSCRYCSNVFKVPSEAKKAVCPDCKRSMDV